MILLSFNKISRDLSLPFVHMRERESCRSHKSSYNLKATQVYDVLLSVSRLINSLLRRRATDYDRN